MPSFMMGLRQDLRYFFGEQQLPNFAGGLNLRDAPTEVAPNESPDLFNVTLDERGGVVKRLGYSKWNAAAASSLFTYGYHSKLLGKLFWYSKSDGKLYSDPGTGVLTLVRTWTAGSDIQIVDFVGKVYATHPVDGLYSSADGTTWASVVAGSGSVPKGSLLAVWQNKLWSAGDPSDKTNVTWCGPGDATKWATADGGGNNHIREKDDAPVTCLFGGAGYDFQSKPSLLVFKEDSTYRIDDSSSGAYITLDGVTGTGSPNGCAELYGKVLVLSKRGLYETTGLSKLVPVSEKIRPRFRPESIDYTTQANWCVGYQGDRFYISVTQNGSSHNDLVWEFHPLQGWITERSDAARCYVNYSSGGEVLLGCSPSVTGQVFKLNDAVGTDNGTAIASRFYTRVFVPRGGHQMRCQTVRLIGRGTFVFKTIPDFSKTSSVDQQVELGTTAGMTWGSGVWGSGVWGGSQAEGYSDPPLHPRLICRAAQFGITETSSLTYTAPALNETGASLVAGAWAVYGIDFQYGPLGLS